METAHPLDRPIWSALTTRQAHLASGTRRALYFDRDYAAFAASIDDTAESLAELAAIVPRQGYVILLQAGAVPEPPGAVAVSRTAGVQMVLDALTPGEPDFAVAPLTDDDAADMLALATLTKPGPFFVRTHALGTFIGVKHDGRLVAMAGERMQPTGFTEISGVCTHPDFRGRGYAGGLMRLAAARILARGETPFLHARAANTGAIALYETLGFRLRRAVTIAAVERR
jgi:predicted GNAT family acetyltransferase